MKPLSTLLHGGHRYNCDGDVRKLMYWIHLFVVLFSFTIYSYLTQHIANLIKLITEIFLMNICQSYNIINICQSYNVINICQSYNVINQTKDK